MRRGEFSHRSIRALSHRRVWNRNTECLIPISFRMLYTYSTRTLRHRRVGSGNKWDYWKDCCELAAHLPCGVVYSIPTLCGNLSLDSSGHAHICWMNLQVALRPGKRGNVIAELALSNEYSDLFYIVYHHLHFHAGITAPHWCSRKSWNFLRNILLPLQLLQAPQTRNYASQNLSNALSTFPFLSWFFKK